MPLQVHPVHRRLAELTLKAHRLGSYQKLNREEQLEINHCLQASATMIERLDQLNSLSFLAYETGDTEWQHELCAQIDELSQAWK